MGCRPTASPAKICQPRRWPPPTQQRVGLNHCCRLSTAAIHRRNSAAMFWAGCCAMPQIWFPISLQTRKILMMRWSLASTGNAGHLKWLMPSAASVLPRSVTSAVWRCQRSLLMAAPPIASASSGCLCGMQVARAIRSICQMAWCGFRWHARH